MSFLERLRQAKNKLQHVETVVTFEDGSSHWMERSADGSFKQIELDDIADTAKELEGESSEPNGIGLNDQASCSCAIPPQLSKRQLKKRLRLARFGFVVDLNPDLQMANVAKGVFLGSQDVAHSWDLLQQHKITHIVNCATGVQNIYEGRIKYLNLSVLDLPHVNLIDYFDEAHAFMQKCVQAGGNVFVHCNAGVSRSPTIVLSYIMRFENKTLKEALNQVQAVRQVCPNPGFLQQLLMYESTLQKLAVTNG